MLSSFPGEIGEPRASRESQSETDRILSRGCREVHGGDTIVRDAGIDRKARNGRTNSRQ